MISWWVALVLLLLSLDVGFCRIGGLCLILLFVRVLIILGGWRRFLCPVQRTPLWPASWLPVLDKSRGSKAAEVQRVWDICDDRLQFMYRDDALNLDGALDHGDVSRAWMVWSSAVQAALADAYRFVGGPVPDRGLVLGRGVFRPHVSTAPLLDLRRRFKAVWICCLL